MFSLNIKKENFDYLWKSINWWHNDHLLQYCPSLICRWSVWIRSTNKADFSPSSHDRLLNFSLSLSFVLFTCLQLKENEAYLAFLFKCFCFSINTDYYFSFTLEQNWMSNDLNRHQPVSFHRIRINRWRRKRKRKKISTKLYERYLRAASSISGQMFYPPIDCVLLLSLSILALLLRVGVCET